MTQSRWKSPVFWTTLSTGIIGVLTALGFWGWVGITQDYVVQVVGAVITLGSILVGGANNPTDPVNF